MIKKTKESLNLKKCIALILILQLDDNYFKCTCSDLEERDWLKRNKALEDGVVNEELLLLWR